MKSDNNDCLFVGTGNLSLVPPHCRRRNIFGSQFLFVICLGLVFVVLMWNSQPPTTIAWMIANENRWERLRGEGAIYQH